MKTLDLNIELKELEKNEEKLALCQEVNALLKQLGKPEKYNLEDIEPEPSVKTAIKWIELMVARATNEPGVNGQATKQVGRDVWRKFDRVMNKLDDHKDGIVELEDDDFNFLDRKFGQAKMVVNRSMSSILVKIEDAFNEAKVKKEVVENKES